MRIPILFLIGTFILPAQQFPGLQSQPEYHIFSNPQRDTWQQPNQVISALHFAPTETVAVFENGYPYFAPRIAPLVKKVYAVNNDVRAFQGRGALPPSIGTIINSPSDPNIAGYTFDTVLMVDTLVTIKQPLDYYLKIIGGLKPGSRLVIIDRILPSAIPRRMDDASMKGQLPGLGFSLSQTFTFLPAQFFLIFKL
jgi:hypothetical protein